jgi:hypothetical protein
MGMLRVTRAAVGPICLLMGLGCSSDDASVSDQSPAAGSAGGSQGAASSGGAGGTRSATQTMGGAGTGGILGGASAGGSGSAATAGGGGVATGGAAGSSESGANDAGVRPPAKACPAADQGGPEAVGVWQNITPKEVCLTCTKTPNNNANFGTAAVAVNPLVPSTVYLGTEEWGFFKSTDCGSTWTKTNTGRGGTDLGKGSQWTLVVDPVDPDVLYTNSGFGVSGVFKSTNAGADWDQVLIGDAVKVVPYGGFMGTYSLDPNDHLHVLASFHAACSAPMTSACFIETKDGGKTWTARNGDPSWNGGEHTILEFLDSTTWLFGNQDALWRSTDSGTTWSKIPGTHSIVHHQQLYRPRPGVYFQSTVEGLLYSNDNGATWMLLQGSPQAAVGVVGTGDTVMTSRAGPWQVPGVTPDEPYFSVSETNPTAQPMKKIDSPAMSDGGLFMAYDPDHHIVYSSNFPAGVWRVVVK